MTAVTVEKQQRSPQRSGISQAAHVEPLSVRCKVLWMLIAGLTQLIWGSYSVVTRWLQTRAHASTFGVAALLPALSWVPTALYVFGPDIVRCARSCGQSTVRCVGTSDDIEQQQQQQEEEEQQQPAPTLRAAVARWLRLQLLALAVGSIVSLAALALVIATLFAPAFLVQLIMVLTPLFTALASRVLLRQPTPHLLGPALVAGTVGTAMVVLGGWLEHRHDNTSTSTTTTSSSSSSSSMKGDIIAADAISHAATLGIGLAVSLAGALLFAGYYLALQATRRTLTTRQQVMASRNAALLITVPLALALDGPRWPWLEALSPEGWGVLLFGSLVAYCLGSMGLQFSTRALGAATVAQLSCLRVVAAIAGSAALLGEVPRHGVTWAGVGIVLVSTGGWLWLTARHDAGKKQQEEVAAVVEEEHAESGSTVAKSGVAWEGAAAAVVAAANGAAAEKAVGLVAGNLKTNNF